MRALIFSIIAILTISGCAFATTYQVATDGSGDFTTIAQVNAASFASGDSVLFRKGDTWVENLSCVSGVVYDAYGVGNKPILNRIGLWQGKTNVTVKNLKCTATAITGALTIEGGSNIIIDGVTIDGASQNAIHSLDIGGSTTYGWAEYITIKNCIFYDAGTTGNQICNLTIQAYSRYITIQNNISYNSANNNIQVYNSAGLGVNIAYAPHDITIKGNECYGSIDQNGIEIGWDAYDCVVENNYLHNNTNGRGIILASSNNNLVKNNIIKDNNESIAITGATSISNLVYHNTIISTGAGYVTGLRALAGVGADNIFKNNLVRSDYQWFNFSVNSGTSDVIFDYNLYYNSTGTYQFIYNGTTYNFADWKTNSAQDSHSISSDPQLKADYKLKATSPCINAGVNVGVTGDYFGNKRPAGMGYDIGAYEFGNHFKNTPLLRNATIN